MFRVYLCAFSKAVVSFLTGVGMVVALFSGIILIGTFLKLLIIEATTYFAAPVDMYLALFFVGVAITVLIGLLGHMFYEMFKYHLPKCGGKDVF